MNTMKEHMIDLSKFVDTYCGIILQIHHLDKDITPKQRKKCSCCSKRGIVNYRMIFGFETADISNYFFCSKDCVVDKLNKLFEKWNQQ